MENQIYKILIYTAQVLLLVAIFNKIFYNFFIMWKYELLGKQGRF